MNENELSVRREQLNKRKTMGAWGTDPFGNDVACDWKYRLEGTDDLSLIERTLRMVVGDYFEASEAEEAIAAADTLARLRGNFYVRNAYTESLDEWVEKNPILPSKELIETAIEALDCILSEPSDLLDFWQESGEFEAWENDIEGLKGRLR